MNPIPHKLQALTAETTFQLPSPAGELELLLSPAPSHPGKETLAVICHPHPLHGGTLSNKVVTTLAKTFQQLNMQTIRFNFRGVGKSTGTYGEGEGELQDLYAVLAWIQQVSPAASLWLAGFSFGAYISILAAMERPFAGLVSVAPPVNHFPLNKPVNISCPWIVVQGEKDEIVPALEVLAWLENLHPKPRLLLFPEAGHFFHGALTELKGALIEELKPGLESTHYT